MHQFSIGLPDNVLKADKIKSVRAFAERTDWARLPYSSSLYSDVIRVVLEPPGTDNSLAEELLLLVANQRMVFYLSSDSKSRAVKDDLWLAWMDRIERIITAYQDEEREATQLCKDKLELSIELLKKSTSLFHSDKMASDVIGASSRDISESADMQMANTSEERIKSALAVAAIAKEYSFNDENTNPKPKLSIWERVKSRLPGSS